MELAREGRKPGWWEPYHLDFGTYVGLEADAVAIHRYQSTLVPGLLQTSAYARAVHEAGIPKLSTERINELVEVRMTRQRLFHRTDPPNLWSILDEAVLHRMVGGQEVMSAQLNRLVEAAALSNVTIQVIPYSAGAHPAAESTFSILDFAGPVASVVYVEGLVGRIYLERAQDLEMYRRVFKTLQRMALSEEDSAALIAEIMRGLNAGT
jgi:hypothetical protein